MEGLEAYAKAAERFRNAVAQQEIQADQTLLPVTISLGVAIGTEPETLDADLLLHRADEALYPAKHKGRNRVEAAHRQMINGSPRTSVISSKSELEYVICPLQ